MVCGGLIGERWKLSSEISAITRIQRSVLNRKLDIKDVLRNTTAAQKMSWTASRKTTRVEDRAYCLLGIFDVNMPLLYGEGMRAFARLQEEITRTETNLSIFAWSCNERILSF